jgi:Transglutaminase-like superfamily
MSHPLTCQVSRSSLPLWVGMAAVLLSFSLSACGQAETTTAADAAAVPDVVTGNIQAGIEKHIDEQIIQGEGAFRVAYEGEELRLKLVRIHLEYLATLGPGNHFACVDMATDDGEFYDVDFFMEGDPGSMSVTNTTVHKINGRPIYVWKQLTDKSWVRAPVDDASDKLLGVRNEPDAFEFQYQSTVPKIQTTARMWLPLAQSDAFQQVEIKSISVPGKQQKLTDSAHGNQVMLLELGPDDSGKPLEIVYRVKRLEVGAYEGDPEEALRHLAPERKVPSGKNFQEIATAAIGEREGDLTRARALYDHVIDTMAYQKCGTGWGQGDAVRACDTPSGNCTDFHSYFIALSRAAGIPARFAIGAALPSSRDEGGVDGYHCWAEFYADGKWWPLDISEGDKFTALSMYYFGHAPANRFEFSRGRDLVVDPGPASGPINFLAYPVVEMDGQTRTTKVSFRFKRTT